MGEAVGITGKFKTKKEKYEEIKNALIIGLSECLRPDDSPVKWESYFTIAKDALELDFMSFGNYGLAMEYIENTFIKEYSDVLVEFAVTNYDSCECNETEKIVYDGKIVRREVDVEEALFYDNEYFCEKEYFEQEKDYEFDSIDELEFDGNIFVLAGFTSYSVEEDRIKSIIEERGGEIKKSTVLKTKYLIVSLKDMMKREKDKKLYNRAIELKEQGKPITIICVRKFYELYEKYMYEEYGFEPEDLYEKYYI